ncbi:MAG TPA: CoA-binding protein [Candidatus Hydrogenedentes bacterium]|nr:CoA-binding protein [Candidatus Hydrogenedentota bacterium]HRK34018.1 CoA-binding protein [Candidatus Hydrogenedentota bacterium]
MGKTIAIIGASADRRKYGNKSVRAFRDGGWDVYPVNAKATEIEGLKSYASIADVPVPLDRVSMYVSPAIGKTLLDDIAAKGTKEFFLNPGSEDAEIIELARAKGLNVINACSIVNIGLRPDMYPDE